MYADGTPGLQGIRAVAPRVLPNDGGAVLDRLIEDLGLWVRRGKACAIVWDIDGTVVRTRKRMLAAIHAYGRTDVTLDQLRGTAPDFRDVVRDFGLHPLRFRLVWDRVFWDGANFHLDEPIAATLSRMERAAKLRIKNIIMTGRNKTLALDTANDLRRRGVPFDGLHCKTFAQKTVPAKTDRIEALIDEGIHIGAFVTDSGEELAGLAHVLKATCVKQILVTEAGAPVRDVPGLDAHVLPVPVLHPV